MDGRLRLCAILVLMGFHCQHDEASRNGPRTLRIDAPHMGLRMSPRTRTATSIKCYVFDRKAVAPKGFHEDCFLNKASVVRGLLQRSTNRGEQDGHHCAVLQAAQEYIFIAFDPV